MKVIKRSLNEEALSENDHMDSFLIIVDGKVEINANDYGEPEDNYLRRDKSFVYDIVPLMQRAYEAGKRGEEFEVSVEKVSVEKVDEN